MTTWFKEHFETNERAQKTVAAFGWVAGTVSAAALFIVLFAGR